MSEEEKTLLEEFFDWLAGLFAPKSSVEDSGETPDKTSSEEPEVTPDEPETYIEPPPIRSTKPVKEDPRTRGL